MARIARRSLVIALTLSAFAAAVLVPWRNGAAATRKPSKPKAAGPRNEVHPIDNFLKRAMQEMVDAVAAGDTTVWSRYLAPECLYTDEEGNTSTKRELLVDWHPLPSAYHGTIRLEHPRVVIVGETAVLTTELKEVLELYDQRLETRFHSTSTWVRKLDGWRMIAGQNSVLPSDHKEVDVDPASFDAYVGKYSLAPEVTYSVAREGKKLYGERSGRPKEELFPLGGDRFFRRGANRGEKVFVRDAQGRVTQMIDRRDNNDLIWRRID